jgi:hypothetical protein
VACVRVCNGLGIKKTRSDGSSYVVYNLDKFRWVPSSDQARAIFERHFFNRTDRVAFHAPWGDPCPAFGGKQLEGLLKSHLTGRCRLKVRWVSKAKPEGELTRDSSNCWRVGSYGPAPDGTTRWLVIDCDGGGEHSAPLADPTAVAISVLRFCWALRIPAYLERSKSCKGWHLWVFFEPAVPANLARVFAFAVLPHDAPLTDGTFADPAKGQGLEVFPKSDNLSNGRTVGAQMWLPWYAQAEKGGNQFYFPADARGLAPYIPDEFKTVDEDKLKAALAEAHAKLDAEEWGDL